ncbi:hypothetical protein [Fibrella arboris]|uniref:hypothetical protein n=1 Tax=Fibrella arboris TaxID=3242486 RepID=UPI00352264CD
MLGTAPTFTGIIQHHVQQFVANGTKADFQALQSGTALLDTDEQCSAYLAAYGDMHRLKLDSAFEALFAHVGMLTAGIEVVDWGCGQGMASGVLLDYVRQHRISLNIRRFTLIEPAKLTLSRAVDHLSVLAAEDTVIKALHDKADKVSTSLLVTDPEAVKIHLFSNLLDMCEVDHQAIAHRIIATQRGLNLFVCVSPAIADFRNQRLRAFRDQFQQAKTLSQRTDSFQGSVLSIYRKVYAPYSVKRTECIFSVQL